ncbi:VOC family protein [Alicyclobacillus curvatus]|jgi:predicted enzyme related to lactoylglutathione lyase|nr:VOC family protein [Alicyclobacillus curvatus]
MTKLQRVGQISMTVHDVDRAVAFYRDVLGLPFVWQTAGMAFFMCGDVRLMLSVPEKAEFDHPGSIIYYAVDDIYETYEELKSKGVEFHGDPHEIGKLGSVTVYMAFFNDSEGNMLAIQAEVSDK